MDWTAFWSGVLGAGIPSLTVAVVTCILTARTDRKLAQYQADLTRQLETAKIWRSKSVEALIGFYEAVRNHLDFLRLTFYFPKGDVDVTPLHEFNEHVDQLLIFFDDNVAAEVRAITGELLLFWNWAQEQRGQGEAGLEATRHKLDHELPKYLDRIRKLGCKGY